jgi:hypothetical protein
VETTAILCTRFATGLIVRRISTIGMLIAIVPSRNRPEAGCLRLSGFRETLTNPDEFPTLISKAKEFMGISNTTSAFSNDVLRIEISGPNRPHLTIVDLPSLIHSENKLQTSGDVSLVPSMVQSYLADQLCYCFNSIHSLPLTLFYYRSFVALGLCLPLYVHSRELIKSG